MMKIAIAILVITSGCCVMEEPSVQAFIQTVPGNNNNLYIGDGNDTLVIVHVGDGFPMLTGIAQGYDGRVVTIQTTPDSASIALTSYDGSSKPENRLVVTPTPGKTFRTLYAGDRIRLRYDGLTALWVD